MFGVASALVFTVLLPYTHENLCSAVSESFHKLFATGLFLSFSCLGMVAVFELERYSGLVLKLCTAWCLVFLLFAVVSSRWRELKLEILNRS